MLKILDEKVLRTDVDIGREYKDCKYLYVVNNYDNLIDDEGYLYCVSMSNDSFDELHKLQEKLLNEGKCCVVSGSYNNGGAIGVQYEYRR